jgi:hypothetical protein
VNKLFAITGTASKAACDMITGMTQGAPQFIIGSDGRKRGVLLGVTHYRRLLRRIEDLEDILTLDRAARSSKKLISYETVRKRLKRAGKL